MNGDAPPGPGSGVIPLPPPTPAAPADDRGAGGRWRGGIVALLVLLLAFLTASTPARNSDVWFHLAAGRMLARGQFAFGSDPFSYTTAPAYWANQEWLFDLVLYGLYQLVGGAGLVVLKALLVTALAALLLTVRRPAGPGGWLPAVCTTLAVLAMSPRLLLQPACASYFLLGLTFWLLGRPHAQDEGGGKSRRHVLLLGVFVLWANLDAWFLLGPLLAALFWVGGLLSGQRRPPGWLVPAAFAACLLNPHTYRAFVVPAELSSVPWTSGLREDVRFQALFASPWRPGYFRAAAGLNAAALAYFALVALGAASFLLPRPGLRGGRLVVWLPFAALAAWQARAIPFFAVVAAPIAALNWQDYLAGGPKASAATIRTAAGRALLALGLLALLVLTWPGWLAGRGREGPHVGWAVEEERSLRRAAEAVRAWRRADVLGPGERVFALAPEVAHYAAWFDLGEPHFLDHRYHLSPEAARDYETVCRSLLPGLAPERPVDRGADWRRVLRERQVAVVVLYDREPQRLFAALQRLAGDPAEWTLLYVAGQAVIFGWNEARPPGGFAALAFDADRLALGRPDERARRELPPAPGRGPARLPPPPDLWQRLVRRPAPRSWESPAASVYLAYYEATEAHEQRRGYERALAACAASLAGLCARPESVPSSAFQVWAAREALARRDDSPAPLVPDDLGPFFRRVGERSPALPLLAIRAARRAVADDPQDANAWLRLGQAYLLLRDLPPEGPDGRLTPLEQVRHVQIATALEQALRLDPDLEAAHHELAFLYGRRQFLDRSLEHRREELRLSRRAGRRPGESAAEAAYRLELLEKDTAKLESQVAEHQDAFAARPASLRADPLTEARAALRLGLALRAADDILLPHPAELLGPPGQKLELDLLLALGRTDQVRAILDEAGAAAGKGALGYYDIPSPAGTARKALYPVPYHLPAYEWLRVVEAWSVGDHDSARAALEALRSELHAGDDHLRRQLARLEAAERKLLPGVFSGPPPFVPIVTADILARAAADRAALERGEPVLRAQQADLWALEGLLDLEQGETVAAGSAFREAQTLCAPPLGTTPFAGTPVAADYRRRLASR